jgi:hypothetical protein
MHHRRSRSEPDIDVTVRDYVPGEDDESVSDSESSVHTVDLYRGWSLPSLDLNLRIPGWFVMLVTLFIFRG